MKEIADRIKELIEHLQLTNKSFAESIDIAPAIISHVLSGRNNPSLHLIQQITNVYTNVNLDYLLNGTGSLIEDKSDNQGLKSTGTKPKAEVSSSSLPPGARLVSPPSGAPVPSKQQEEPIQSRPSENKPEFKIAPTTREGRKVTENEVSKSSLDQSITNVNPRTEKEIERIVVFYTDRSFREYLPEA